MLSTTRDLFGRVKHSNKTGEVLARATMEYVTLYDPSLINVNAGRTNIAAFLGIAEADKTGRFENVHSELADIMALVIGEDLPSFGSALAKRRTFWAEFNSDNTLVKLWINCCHPKAGTYNSLIFDGAERMFDAFWKKGLPLTLCVCTNSPVPFDSMKDGLKSNSLNWLGASSYQVLYHPTILHLTSVSIVTLSSVSRKGYEAIIKGESKGRFFGVIGVIVPRVIEEFDCDPKDIKIKSVSCTDAGKCSLVAQCIDHGKVLLLPPLLSVLFVIHAALLLRVFFGFVPLSSTIQISKLSNYIRTKR